MRSGGKALFLGESPPFLAVFHEKGHTKRHTQRAAQAKDSVLAAKREKGTVFGSEKARLSLRSYMVERALTRVDRRELLELRPNRLLVLRGATSEKGGVLAGRGQRKHERKAVS